MTTWPSPNDYTAAIQNPHLCFRDADLTRSTVEKHALTRMPKVWTGNFAQVYELRNAGNRWAVKCFTRSSDDLRARYARISETVRASHLPYFVEFRLLDEEMLVNGKRHGIVKMRWVDGHSLDKYVETNLFQPSVLVALAGQIIKMVRDLETSGIAHGDLQHGNIILRGSQVTLVDYDGMFVPAFIGSEAPEQGLPSYQHPRRDARTYDSKLDRFPLLVITTGLYALAVEPALWYQFSTGDNLLFTRGDFENPDQSSLFKKLRASSNDELRQQVNLLRSACIQTPGQVPLLEKPANIVPFPTRPWWVTFQGEGRSGQGPPKDDTAHLGKLVVSGRVRWSLASTVVFLIGLTALHLAGLLTIQAVVLLSSLGAAAYVVERHNAFRRIPAFSRRADLEQQMNLLRAERKAALADQARLQAEPDRITQRQAQELAKTLKDLQSQAVATALGQIDIVNLTTIHGIGLALVGNLRAAGILNAHHLHQTRDLSRLRGIGPKRQWQIRTVLVRWEAEARSRIPARLPLDVENRIVSEHQRQRQGMVAQLTALGQKLAGVQSELRRREVEYAQVSLPSFSQFLRHNL